MRRSFTMDNKHLHSTSHTKGTGLLTPAFPTSLSNPTLHSSQALTLNPYNKQQRYCLLIGHGHPFRKRIRNVQLWHAAPQAYDVVSRSPQHSRLWHQVRNTPKEYDKSGKVRCEWGSQRAAPGGEHRSLGEGFRGQ
jgi:hypothetical protein